MADSHGLTSTDIAYLRVEGLSSSGVHAQLDALARPPQRRRLLRPCVPGDGVWVLDDSDIAAADREWLAGDGESHFGKWVPASGAASRMFHDLAIGADQATAQLAADLERFPFANQLKDAVNDLRDPRVLTRKLISRDGLGLAHLPKALIPFHSYNGVGRTALEEQIVEARHYLGEVPSVAFTVAREHRAGFEDALTALGGGAANVSLSEQSSATRTLALDIETGKVLRDEDGTPLLRPGGHGALLGNLQNSPTSHVFIKNIDNILPAPHHSEIGRWKRTLGGIALGLARQIAEARQRLNSKDDPGEISALLRRLGLDGAPQRSELETLLDRPLRVCGMVRNEGEPGGGPFWVRLPNGEIRPQIVESAEVDLNDPQQQQIWASSTHFNPVDLTCVLERTDGSRFTLSEYSEPSAVFLNTRGVHGRQAAVLERAGLWNGSMAYWHTVFVEVPNWTFAPVKSVFDLLRPEHQA